MDNSAGKLHTSEEIKTSVNTNNKDVKPAKRRRRSCRGCVTVLLLALMVSVCCAVVLLGGYASGYLQKFVCQSVTSDSPVATRLKCDSLLSATRIENGNSDFPVKIAEPTAPVASGDIDASSVYEKTNKSVVGIGVKGDEFSSDQVIGSGFVVSENGLIATNQHVVSEVEAQYFVKFEGSDELVDAAQIYRDPVNDIAIIRVNKSNLPALALGDSDKLKPGQPVVAIGNPLGDLASTVTSGIISGLNREVTIGQSFLRSNVNTFEDTIQTDAAINPGNSGGPLLDANGSVVGINFATAEGYENLSFALPVSYLRTRIDEIRQFGKFRIPYLGLRYRSRLLSVGREVFVGATIVAVDPQGSANGKLVAGDTVITFNNINLDEQSLANLIQKTKIGDKVDLVVITRQGERKVVNIEIMETPANPLGSSNQP